MATKQAPEDRVLHEMPPRSIDWFTQATIIFGGFLQQFGWFFFGFGMIFFWIFAWNSSPMVALRNFGSWEPATGTVFMIEQTNSSVNETPVYKITLQYEVDGQTKMGYVYETGRSFSEGQLVEVDYNVRNPEKVRLEGAREAMFPWFTMFVVIFPIVGLVLVYISITGNLKFLQLLKIGEYTRGEKVKKEATGGEIVINNRHYPIYEYKFKFSFNNNNYYATCSTHLTDTVEDEEKEIILFDRFNPEHNIVYDAMPNAPKILKEGMLDPAYLSKGIVLILPAISLIAHGLVAFVLWRL
jgi:hypothetical protein